MADTIKISALQTATTVSGGEYIPIVQDSITKKLDVLDIFDAIAGLSEAATISGGEYLPIIQDGASKKLNTLDILDVTAIPSNNNLEAMWLGDELPEIPDNIAGITYLQNTWVTVGGWLGGGGGGGATLSVATTTGAIRATATTSGSFGMYTTISGSINKTVRLRIRASRFGTIQIGNAGGGETYTTISGTTDWENHDFIKTTVSDASFYIALTAGIPGDWFEVDWFYVGTGAYSTPVIDNSGNRLYMSANGCIPDGKGSLTFDGTNDYLVTSNNLTTIPNEMFFHMNFPNGHAQLTTNQGLFNYKGTSTTLGYVWIYRPLNSDTMTLSYCNGSAIAFINFSSYFTGYSTTHIDVNVSINWTTGAVLAYRNGVLFGTGTMTTPVKPIAGSPLYIGSYLGTGNFLGGVVNTILYFSRLPSNQEIYGLYHGEKPTSLYKLINWQNSRMTDSTITTSSFAVTAASGYVIPYGKYEFSATSPLVQLQFLSGSTWYGASYLSGQVCADGVNVRAYNPTASGVTVYYRKLDL